MLDLPDAEAYDAAVASAEGIDTWCTSTDWVLPLTAAMGANDPFALRTDSGWGVFDRAEDLAGRRVVLGVDRVWGFACPVVGRSGVWDEVADALAEKEWDVLLIPGLVEGGAAWHQALGSLGRLGDLHRAGEIVRCRADLSGGFDNWFDRRSPRFRQQLRRVRREADAAGVVINDISATDSDELLERLITIESSSWKGAHDDGLCAPEMAQFYRHVLRRLAPDRIRCLVARRDGNDVGYIVGGVRGTTYRGLQLSYSEQLRDLGVGHLLQLDQLDRLAAEGIGTYDLGMDIPYKRRWSDSADPTTAVAVLRAK